MKFGHLFYKTFSGRILLVVLAVLFTVCVVPANAAPEPGTVTIVINEEPDTVDPGEANKNITGEVILSNVIESLADFDPSDGSINPKLATSWEQTGENNWRYSLRKGVKFHDGEDFNAEAVVFSLKRIYNKKIQSGIRAKFFGANTITGKVLGSHTVEFTSERPEPLMPLLMGLLPICSPKTESSKTTPQGWTRKPIGTGPYTFAKWDVGTRIVLERFDGYWGKQPQVKKGIYIWRTESSVRASMVKIGEADLAPMIAIQDATDKALDVSYFNTETTDLRFGGKWDPPLNDRRFRLACNYAVNREGMRGSIFSEDVVPATQFVVPGILGYNYDLKPWAYDPQKAKQLLAEARKDGVPVDKEILLVARTGFYPGIEEMMEAILAMYREVGINAKLKMVDKGVWNEYNRKPFPEGLYMLNSSHDNNKGDAKFTVFGKHHSDGNQSGTTDKTFDDLIERAAQTAPGKGREQLFQAAFKHFHEQLVGEVMLFHMVGYARVGQRINYKPSRRTVIEIPLASMTFK